TTGYNGKLSFNVSTAYKDRFYFGLNLNTYFTDYTKTTSFYEENNNPPFAGASVRDVTFENDVHTYGNGFSFQLGAIAKITPSFRAGLAYESPTWYQLNDDVRQIVLAHGSNLPQGSYGISDSDFFILYEPYNLKTPGKFTGSLAYVFGKYGLISVDYSLKDYSNTRFSPKDDYFRPINAQMSTLLDVAGELRIGAEYRIKNWNLRGGFRYDESPYKDQETIGDLTGFSGGFGYQFTRTRLDLTYTHTQRDSQLGFFSQGLTSPIYLNTQNNNISFGMTFEL
ncbi:MAG TPA: outer membrane protein transport protein, partial [Flavobacterium sp.]|nr:outer membrane protein transport protein [Flavobacterium sp.]